MRNETWGHHSSQCLRFLWFVGFRVGVGHREGKSHACHGRAVRGGWYVRRVAYW
jgi:hypothetical protein